MRFSGPLFFCLWAVLGVLAAQENGPVRPTIYLEVGTTLTLEPDLSAVPQPVSSIRWKYGPDLVLDWAPGNLIYYGSFRGRTTLDPQTVRLDINSSTMADSGIFTLETNIGTVGSYEVKVIKPPPTPSITTQPLVCVDSCALRCTADTQDLGPVTYKWKKDEGEWTEGDQLKVVNRSKTPEKFSCRLITHVRSSEAKMAKDNPLYKPEPLPKPVIEVDPLCDATCKLKCTADTKDLGPVTYEWKEGEGSWAVGGVLMAMESSSCEKFSCRLKNPVGFVEASEAVDNPRCPPPVPVWVIVLIVIIVLLAVGCAALFAMVYKCPEHPFSKRVQKWISCKKQAVGASEASNGGKAGQPSGEGEPLNSSV